MKTFIPVHKTDEDTDALIEHVMTGKPLDAKLRRRLGEEGDLLRREIFEKHGLVDIGVPAIRELRGELPE